MPGPEIHIDNEEKKHVEVIHETSLENGTVIEVWILDAQGSLLLIVLQDYKPLGWLKG